MEIRSKGDVILDLLGRPYAEIEEQRDDDRGCRDSNPDHDVDPSFRSKMDFPAMPLFPSRRNTLTSESSVWGCPGAKMHAHPRSPVGATSHSP